MESWPAGHGPNFCILDVTNLFSPAGSGLRAGGEDVWSAHDPVQLILVWLAQSTQTETMCASTHFSAAESEISGCKRRRLGKAWPPRKKRGMETRALSIASWLRGEISDRWPGSPNEV